MKRGRDLDDAMESFEDNPAGLPQSELRRMRQDSLRSQRRFNGFLLFGAGGVVGFLAGRQEWVELFGGTAILLILFAVIWWQVRNDRS